MTSRRLLLALAPWPILLRLVQKDPKSWTVWGELPPQVERRLTMLGVEVRAEALPKPLHHAPIPDWMRRSWSAIVVPALGHPLPSRWPVLRWISQLSCPLFVANYDGMQPVDTIPEIDAFTWAFDQLEQAPVVTGSATEGTMTCVRADLLGDVLLALPALDALNARYRVTLVVRNEWVEWMRALRPNLKTHGISIHPWSPPVVPATETCVDLSPLGWTSPLTPAIARSVPAIHHTRELKMPVTWPEQSMRRSDIGLIVPAGSSGERALPPSYWDYAAQRLEREMGVTQWIVLRDHQPPSDLLDVCKKVCVVVGVSTGITHLAALTGTPALVIEHPTTVPWLYRAPVSYVRYMRPQNPWWRENPSEQDLDRALAGEEESYGFEPGEFEVQVDQEISHLAATRTLCPKL